MVVQIALSLVLLVSTGLFVRTLGNLQNVDAGFNRRGLVLFRIDATSAGYTREQFAGAANPHPGAARATAWRPRRHILQRRAAVAVAPEQEDLRARACRRPARRRSSTPTASRPISSPRWSCRSSSAAASRMRDDGGRAEGRGRQPGVRAHVLGRRESRRPPHRVSDRRRRMRVEIVGVGARREIHRAARRRCRRRSIFPRSSGSTATRISRCGLPRTGGGRARERPSSPPSGPRVRDDRSGAPGAEPAHAGRADRSPARAGAALRAALRLVRRCSRSRSPASACTG